MQQRRHLRVLVAEDEFYLADDLNQILTLQGVEVIGPFGCLADLRSFVSGADSIDGAVLDIDLAGEKVYTVADLLLSRQTPVVFTTGYDPDIIPARFGAVPRLEKPFNLEMLLDWASRLPARPAQSA
jgi:DNA-binding NtrC family response regulator